MYIWMKSEFSAIWSSVIPISLSSSNSLASNISSGLAAGALWGALGVSVGGGATCMDGGSAVGGGALGAGLER